MSKQDYSEELDSIVKCLGKRASLNRIIRQVNCTIASTIKTKLDEVFCNGLKKYNNSMTFKTDDETVTYSV